MGVLLLLYTHVVVGETVIVFFLLTSNADLEQENTEQEEKEKRNDRLAPINDLSDCSTAAFSFVDLAVLLFFSLALIFFLLVSRLCLQW